MVSADQQAGTGGYGSLNGSMQTFLAEVQKDLEQGVLSPRVLNDPELHRAELDRIFTKCWVFVGHVSEIPQPGDYVLRYIGEDQFILVRDEQGEIQLLMNNCVHRASPVCRAEKGNTSHFRCPYHGWIYKNSGEWNGAPFRAKAYRKIDASRWGLRKAPRVDSYQGLIFACLDPDAVSLREYLGDMCWYLDVLFGLNEQGMRAAGDPHRWVVPANWKSGAENFVGDAYHVQSAHRSLEDIGLIPDISGSVTGNFHVAIEGGHGLIVTPAFLPESHYGIMDYPPEVTSTFDLSGFSPDQREFLESRYTVVGFTIFPNLSLIKAATSIAPGRLPVSFTCLRQWQPRGPEEFELWNWPLVWNAAPQEFNEASYQASVLGFSPSGVFEQDDTVVWRGGPMVGRSPFARKDMKLNFQMGLDGMSEYEPQTDWIGPGEASTTAFGERNQLRWWRRWSELLAKS
ncbi:aromatic ring-hydroxylating oxygenase subunit alpha [Streptomyces griseorubiginosus]|uniref:aromatic ring-hydroxylating oxygenase subunit alpha n=1 Tax=Streptomyces griseorubiginosus TaxID=67304 RepID=UPI001AD61F6C|nr:Rieske 2Fe-2S domain-containing protein [Streptomyces griseorubiginosus]MBO4252304.1 Rieske 2Fe-2S domain-containing protein [Streptomyces griseorubiginosus]